MSETSNTRLLPKLSKRESIKIDYWDIVEAALTSLPEDSPYRKDALAAFDHLKERVLANRENQ